MTANEQNLIPHLLKAKDIEALPEVLKVHPLNPQAIRRTKFLSDALGLTRLGIHLVKVEPGHETTEFHFHHEEEEFIYILAGRGVVEIGESEVEVAAGDFMGFTAPSLPHCMKNPFDEELVYLMGGERRHSDICDYPRLKKRIFRLGNDRHLVEWDDIKPF